MNTEGKEEFLILILFDLSYLKMILKYYLNNIANRSLLCHYSTRQTQMGGGSLIIENVMY